MDIPKYFYFRVKVVNKGTAIELEDASDTDVVEVIRCKDCEHFRIGKDGKTGVCGGKIRALDFYCADGQKAM